MLKWIERNQPARSLTLTEQVESLRTRLAFAIDIARALAYLHARGILHRDLKLENLLLTENQRVKVCDFGFSRIVAQTESERRRLSFCGSDGYMAPELILCLDDYDTAVDVFSFGIVVLSLLVLQVPLGQGPSDKIPFRRVVPGFGLDEKVVLSHVLGQVETDPVLKPWLERLVKECILRCTSIETKDRPSMKRMLVVLKEIELQVVAKLKHLNESLPANLNVGLIEPSIFTGGKPAFDSTLDLQPLASQEGLLSANALDTGVSSVPMSPLFNVGPVDQQQFPSVSQLQPRQLPFVSNSLNQLDTNIPHRFTVTYKPLTKKVQPCDACRKQIQGFLHTYLVCDDCGFSCHKKCAKNVAASCKNALHAGSDDALQETSRRPSANLLATTTLPV